MSQAIVIEVRGAIAGLVVGSGDNFRFFSSEPAFDTLDGRQFRSISEAQRTANAHRRGKSRAAAA